jgi:GT2 family glycosyltransferase
MMPDGTIQDSYALEPTLLGVFYEQTRLHLLFGGRTLGIRSLTRDDYTVRQTVEQVVGACLFVRREAYAQVGGFDPAYFMYFEDTDFCVRLRHAGWEIWFLPEARILHLVGGSSQDEWRTRALMVSCYNASRYYFYHRYQGARAGKILKILVFVGALIRLTGWTARALVQNSARDKVLLFRDVLRRTTRMNPHDPGR